MKDFEEFPVVQRLKGRNHCLGDKDCVAKVVFHGNYAIGTLDKCEGKSHKVAASSADITKQPRYNCQGQGYSKVNQKKNLTEQANRRTVGRNAENLHAISYNKRERQGDRKNISKMKKTDTVSALCSDNNKICQEKGKEDKPEKFEEENRESERKKMKVDPSGQCSHSARKAGEKYEYKSKSVVHAGEEKKDREKRDKSEIDRKNKERQIKMRLNGRKETSPKELLCDPVEKMARYCEYLEPKNWTTKRDSHAKDDNRFKENLEKSLKSEKGTSFNDLENQQKESNMNTPKNSIQEKQLTHGTSQQIHQLHRQKSAEEHMGDLGNLVGDLNSLWGLASLTSPSYITFSPEKLFIKGRFNECKAKSDEENQISKDTEYKTKEGLNLDKEVGFKEDLVPEKGEKETKYDKNIIKHPNDLQKEISDLEKDIEQNEKIFREIQECINGLEFKWSLWTPEIVEEMLQVCTVYQRTSTALNACKKRRPEEKEHKRHIHKAALSRLPTSDQRRKGDKLFSSDPSDSDGRGHNSYRGRKSNGEDLSEKENRNHDDEKDRDEKEDPPLNRKGPTQELYARSREETPKKMAIDPNYKYRRKHGQLRDGLRPLSDFLGHLLHIDQDIPPDLMAEVKGFIEDVNPCLVLCLKKQTENDLELCEICTCLMALTTHFGNCNSEVLRCNLCTQLFRLVQQHVLLCRENDSSATCPVLVCRKISFLIDENPLLIFTKEGKIWRKLKKYMGGYIQNRKEKTDTKVEDVGDTLFSMTSLTSINPFGFQSLGTPVNPPTVQKVPRPSTQYMPSLTIIPEDQDRSLNVPDNHEPPAPSRVSSSEPIVKKRDDGTIEFLKPSFRPKIKPRKPLLKFGSAGKLPVHPPSPMVTGPPPSFTIPKNEPLRSPTGGKPIRKVSFKMERQLFGKFRDVEPDAFPEATSSVPTPVESEDTSESESQSSIPSEPSSLEKIYGFQLKSIREGSQRWHMEDPQFLSLKEKPTGFPGIGEVVYGYRDVLLDLIKYWEELRLQYKEFGRLLQKSVKEEGVIYPDCKKKLMIMGHRYQKDFQWVRLTHLGRGMFGNCHLASDYNTDYQFCIKKIHISKYREDEIKIWSDLDHPNIVKFHGALRRKEKIYIISEFIPGGNLTEVINSQRTLMRRLSQRNALRLFNQLLKVLIYLEKKSVIHEDIKSDNILLREDGKEIVVADFGVARRQTSKVSNLVGTPSHFSPEKAKCSGHNFKSDLWAAMCVLVHILSGHPPWVKRYPNATAIHFLIATKEAPVEDIPKNIHHELQDLIKSGLEKQPQNRPSAKELLQHQAFQLINEGADNLYSVLNSGSLTDDDTRLPSNTLTGPTREILEEVEESLNNPNEMFKDRVVIREDITDILGKTNKMEDTAAAKVQSEKKLKNELPSDNVDFRFPGSMMVREKENPNIYSKLQELVLDVGSKDSTSGGNHFIESLKKSISATPEEIYKESMKDPEDLLMQYLYDDFSHLTPIDTNLTVLPLYLAGEADMNHESSTKEPPEDDKLNISGSFYNNLPIFLLKDDEQKDVDDDEESEIDRLHARALNEQLSKTSSTSDLLGVGSQSSQINSGSHGSSEFNQDHIIQTLMEEPENAIGAGGSSSRSRSGSTRSDGTSRKSSHSSSSAISESVLNLLSKPPDGVNDSHNNSNATVGGNLPNSILFDFESSTSKSKSSERYYTPKENISGEDEAKEEETGTNDLPQKTRDEEGQQIPSDLIEGNQAAGDTVTKSASKMIPIPFGRESTGTPPLSTMWEEWSKDAGITEDDLFASDEPSNGKSGDLTSKSEGSLKGNSSLNLSGQEFSGPQSELVAQEPIRPFKIAKDPDDPSKQEVVVDPDPSKALPTPVNFKRETPKLNLQIQNPSKPRDSSKRLSNPDMKMPYSPLTPQKYYTPQITQRKPPFSLTTPTSGYYTSTPDSILRGAFPSPRSASPRSQKEQDEEYEKLVRDLSVHSGEPLHELDEPTYNRTELQSSLTEEEEFEYSLKFVIDNYVTAETNDKSIKVEILKLDGEPFTTKLSYEYSTRSWKNFVEENFSRIKTSGVEMLTLCFMDNRVLDLQEKPIDCHQDYRVSLKVVEVTEHGRDNLAWYCQNGICRSGGGIPV
ncbi:uncharacterized protein LOC133193871 [Saccostrea echinata]|uniref:uncharacterized protein LOC133193871 n=1 Tax=Saccostrea echinata TaxID=191078 RepID=UPI002A7F37F5|nr:uncharacterized protein LOC133193871 [Saccostrea echinata]